MLRKNGADVGILSPFAKGVVGYPRLTQARRRELYFNFLKHWTAVTPNKTLKRIRKIIQQILHPGSSADKKVILGYLQDLLGNNPDVVLISTYTMSYDIRHDICEICQQWGISVIIGGSALVHKEIAAKWHNIPGVTAVYAGEPEPLYLDAGNADSQAVS